MVQRVLMDSVAFLEYYKKTIAGIVSFFSLIFLQFIPNDTIMNMAAGDLLQVVEERDKMAMDCEFTYLLGPVRIALRPRLITEAQR